MKRVLILGSTGSIGTQALDVISSSDALVVAGLAAGSDTDALFAQAARWELDVVAIGDESGIPAEAPIEVLAGDAGFHELILRTEPDLVLNAIVGSAGLGPTVAALSQGIDVALANKESLVVGGELVTTLAEAAGARIIPVDSEHSALHQLIAHEPPGTVERLIVTASGGPFRGRTDLSAVTREEALAHPTWEMGGKITIDSATLMNKGLEVIEAHHLFGIGYDAIDVVVHPQSLIHALVHLNDGASLAHLGSPDMRVPISYALHHPDRADVPVEPLDLAAVGELSFEQPDLETFPCLRLAREAGIEGGTAPCILNAANEVAVAAFLADRIPFTGIAEIVERTLGGIEATAPTHFDDLFACDEHSRAFAAEIAGGIAVR